MIPWNDNSFLAFDFETAGTPREFALQPWRKSQGTFRATSLVWGRQVNGGFFSQGSLHPTRAMMKEMLEQALDEKITLVGWNTVFDISVLLAYDLEKLVLQCRWLDGMLLWRHYDLEPEYDLDRSKKRSYGLKEAVRSFIPSHAGYEEGITFNPQTPEEWNSLHKYNIQDTDFTLRLAKRLYKALEPRQLKAALIEAQSLPLIALANLRGMLIDPLACRELEAHMTSDAAKAAHTLKGLGITPDVVKSPTKLGKVLFDDWKLPVLKENKSKKTGKITRSTDKAVLHELAFVDPRAKTIRSWREALNNRSKFAIAPRVSADYNADGRAHPQAIIFGAYSGRLIYASKQGKNKDAKPVGWAIHQEKRDPEFRSILCAPPGYDLMEFDAAGQEFRWMAIASGDTVMLQLCLPGEDPHSFMGAKIINQDPKTFLARVRAGEKQAKEIRQLGKVNNLASQYRTSAAKLRMVARVQYDIPMTLDEAKHNRKVYLGTYVGVPTYWTKQIEQTKMKGYVETFAGRRVTVTGDWTGPMGWSMGSTAINYRIQGTGADQKYLALMLMKDYLSQIDAHFAFDMHDGIYLYVPEARSAQAGVDIKKLLDNLPYGRAWGFTPPIPLPWDCKIGKTWGSLHEVTF